MQYGAQIARAIKFVAFLTPSSSSNANPSPSPHSLAPGHPWLLALPACKVAFLLLLIHYFISLRVIGGGRRETLFCTWYEFHRCLTLNSSFWYVPFPLAWAFSGFDSIGEFRTGRICFPSIPALCLDGRGVRGSDDERAKQRERK